MKVKKLTFVVTTKVVVNASNIQYELETLTEMIDRANEYGEVINVSLEAD